MAKQKTVYQCSECGYESPRWMGKCPDCGNWGTLSEQRFSAPLAGKEKAGAAFDATRVVPLHTLAPADALRTKTQMEEFDRVLGGGIVRGSVVLAGGEPGIGKSTLFLQAADALKHQGKVLYISAEESGEQVRMRAKRLGLSGEMLFLGETQLGEILAAVDHVQPKFLIIDSIQTIFDESIASAPGSVSQVRECASALARLAKSTGIAVFLIGHVTKDGALAGPRVLEHLVDTVLYFEGERNSSFRILRAVKNRFGSTNEMGVFEMSDAGMQEVRNPSALMLSDRGRDIPGCAVYCGVEGTRPMLLEVEALVSPTSFGNPRRMATGLDLNRVSLIIAVLEKKIGLKLYNQDIFVNVGGGIRMMEPALDLAVAASIVSSFRNKPIAQGTVFLGEVALTGEIRHVSQMEKRIAEAKRMGFSRMILPATNLKSMKKSTDLEWVGARTLMDAFSAMFAPHFPGNAM